MRRILMGASAWALALASGTGLAPATAAQAGTAQSGTEQWRFVQTTRLPDSNILNDVSVTASGGAWAVGVIRGGHLLLPIVQRLSGDTWKPVPLPKTFTTGLDVVAASSNANVWAFHWSGVVVHWNGKKWTQATVKDLRPKDAEAIGPTDVWTVDGTSTARHWNGRTWLSVRLPANATAIHAVSASNVWAAGSYGDRAAVLHWNGKAWRLAAKIGLPKADPRAATSFEDITVSGKTVWAVGGHTYWPYRVGYRTLPIALRLTAGRPRLALGGTDRFGPFRKVAADGSGGVWTLGGVEGVGTQWFGRFAGNGCFKGYVTAPDSAAVPLPTYLTGLENRPGTSTVWSVGRATEAEADFSNGVYLRTG